MITTTNNTSKNNTTNNNTLLEVFMSLNSKDDLIDFLDKEFPEKCASPGQSIESIWLEAGKREVVRILQSLSQLEDMTIREENLINSPELPYMDNPNLGVFPNSEGI